MALILQSHRPTDSLALFITLALWVLWVLGVAAWWTFRGAESRKAARKGVAVFLFGISGIFGALRLADGYGLTRSPGDPGTQAWLALSALGFAFLGALAWRMPPPNRR